MKLSIVIPTFGRDQVLIESIRFLLRKSWDSQNMEMVVVDQTARHCSEAEHVLSDWSAQGVIRWIRLFPPGTAKAMNVGLSAAKGRIVLFLDDDIVPMLDLVTCHLQAHKRYPEAWAVAGRVLQPEDWGSTENTSSRSEIVELAEGGKSRSEVQDLRRGEAKGPKSERTRKRAISFYEGLNFAFNGAETSWVSNVMAGNLSVKREKALAIGGFDENFSSPVAYRFETEFAKRIILAGGKIRFEPKAAIRHLRAPSGGTRSKGSHLNSASPVHGVGDYYYALRCGHGLERLFYMLRRPFREIRTKYHMRHPWWIPVKFFGEMRAMLQAIRLYRQGPKLIDTSQRLKI